MLSVPCLKELKFCWDLDSDIVSRLDNSSQEAMGCCAELSAISPRRKRVLLMPSGLA